MEKSTINTQLDADVGGAVILVNKFTVPPEDVEQFMKVFQATTKVMKQEPGSSRHNCIGVLLAVLRSLTMQFLSQ